jgi:RimJ/RimL family protein N-acetyltransferase
MNIKFFSLLKDNFPKLQQWLNNPHVNLWYGESQKWSMQDVISKYETYCNGYKIEDAIHKPIHAFIINLNDNPIGYIQYYNAHDFKRDGYELIDMPKSLAAIDVFIGEDKYLGKSYASEIISQFLEEYVFENFDYVWVDPNKTNKAAIHCFQKIGFKVINKIQVKSIQCMLKSRDIISLIEGLEQKLLQVSIRKSKDKLDKLLSRDFKEFGSSGNVYTKQDILERLPVEENRKFTVYDFETKELSTDVFLVTFRCIVRSKVSLRSSIWKNIDSNWQIIFHQGTGIINE